MGKGSENILSTTESNETSARTKYITPSININESVSKVYYSWSEIEKHNSKNDMWIVLNDNVYNITKFRNKHPGGNKILDHYAGQDATVG